MSDGIQGAMEAAQIIKDCKPNTPTVIGGPHMSTFPEKTLENASFDYGVVGEGEQTMLDLVLAMQNAKKTINIPGLLTKNNQKISQLIPRERISDLDQLSPPSRELFPNEKYKTLLGLNPVTYILTSRGCPFACTFCDHGLWGRHTTYHSPEWVINEIKKCLSLGAKEIYVYDETFSLDKKRAKEICKLIIENRIHFSWIISSRVDTIDIELISLLKKAGCRQIRFGVESGVEKNLRKIKKNITKKKISKAFDLCNKVGIETYAYFMIGLPLETLPEIEKTINFAIDLNPDWVSFNILTLKPGTEVYRQAVEKGCAPPNLWKGLLTGDVLEKDCFWISSKITKEDLLSMKKKAYMNFYIRRSFIKKKLKNIFITPYYQIYSSIFYNFIWRK